MRYAHLGFRKPMVVSYPPRRQPGLTKGYRKNFLKFLTRRRQQNILPSSSSQVRAYERFSSCFTFTAVYAAVHKLQEAFRERNKLRHGQKISKGSGCFTVLAHLTMLPVSSLQDLLVQGRNDIICRAVDHRPAHVDGQTTGKVSPQSVENQLHEAFGGYG